jgi:catalase
MPQLSSPPRMSSAPLDSRGQDIARLLRQQVLQNAAATGIARRDAHPKPHGLVAATFIVAGDVPADLRHGLFAAPCTYQAWIRFSNGSPQIEADSKKDQRGLAIKLLGVPGDKLLDEPGEEGSQDIVLANAPCFFIRTADDYVAFVNAQVKRPAFRVLGFFFGPNPFRWRIYEFRKLLASLGRTSDLLAARYWSQVPYRLGPHVVKYSARPATPAPTWPASTSPDFLRTRLADRLSRESVSFDFMVQLQTDPASMPVDDATVLWDETRAPFRKEATIAVPQQNVDTPERWSEVDRLAFSPWHALPAHEPLGPMNEIRRQVYQSIAAARRAFNAQRTSGTSTSGPL